MELYRLTLVTTCGAKREATMRRLLFSTATLILLAAPAFAQPHSNEGHSNRVGKASVAPQVQDRAQAELRHQQPPPQRGGDFDRGNRGPAPQAAIPAPPSRGDRDRGELNRGDRGGDNGRRMGFENRDRDDRRTFNDNRDFGSRPGFNRDAGRDVSRGANRDFGRDVNRGRTDFNRDGRTDFRPDYRRGANFGGPRHDFSGFRDYHRSFHVSRRFYAPAYRRPSGWYEHRWSFGAFLPTAFWVRDYWLIDFADYDLPPPPYGAVWVRVGPDALLVDQDTGEIITVAYDVFY